MLRIVHLALTGTPLDWRDSHASASPTLPFIIAGSAARLRFFCTNLDATAPGTVTGLSAITLEIYKDRTCRDLLIAPAAVSLESGAAALTLSNWTADTGYHFQVDLTGAETAAATLDAEASVLDAWMEIRAQLNGERCFLGSGPLRIHRGADGGTVTEATQYYTKAEVDAILAEYVTLTNGNGYSTLTVNGTEAVIPSGGTPTEV